MNAVDETEPFDIGEPLPDRTPHDVQMEMHRETHRLLHEINNRLALVAWGVGLLVVVVLVRGCSSS